MELTVGNSRMLCGANVAMQLTKWHAIRGLMFKKYVLYG